MKNKIQSVIAMIVSIGLALVAISFSLLFVVPMLLIAGAVGAYKLNSMRRQFEAQQEAQNGRVFDAEYEVQPEKRHRTIEHDPR